jgi:RND superfamily putative drug exporter
MYYRLGHWMHDRRWWVVALWLSLAGLLHWVAPTWSSVTKDGDLEQLPATTTTARATKLCERAFPADRAASQIVLVMAREENGLTLEDRQYAIRLAQRVEESTDLPLVDVWTEKTPVVGPQLKSRSGHAQRIVLRLTNDFMATDNIRVLAAIRQLIDRQATEKPPGLQVGITGSAAIGGDMLTAAAESVRNTHRATLALVVLALLAIYRSPRLAIIPLLAISLAASISFDLLTLAAWWSQSFPEIWLQVRIFTTTKIFIVVILFGAGTDYCLFFIARYRELLQARLAAREAIAQALGNVGTALAASAMTTVVGLAMMGWAQFGKFAYSGPAIAICLLVTLAVCITLVPALLATALGNLPGKKPVQNGMDPSNTGPQPSIPWQAWWSALADVILRRPGKVLLLCLIFILPLAWLGWDVPVTYDLLGDLPAQRVSRQGAALMVAHFPPGEIGPLVVLAQLPEGGLHTVEGQLKIAQLVKPLDDLAGIERVRSLYQPTGDPPGTVRLFSSAGLQVLASKGSPLTQAAFVSSEPPLNGIVTRLYLILTDEPFSPAAVMTCQKVEQTLRKLGEDTNSPWYGATFELLGPTAGIRDLEMVTLADRKKIQWLVAIAVWLVLLALLRRPLLSCYLIGTVLLSYLVTLGITNTFFGWIVGSNYVGLDWKVPLFLFVILTAVGQDYNIYLVTRILEEQRRHGLREGLRQAMIHTGGIITSCGVIMAGTFVSMTTGSLLGIVELGFALSLGILLDTFFIRSILVPSLIALTAHD